mgnify:CR=1 FL=1
MNNLEKKIKENKSVIEKKFANKNIETSKNEKEVKSFFNKDWDKGWGNYGKTFKPVEIKF